MKKNKPLTIVWIIDALGMGGAERLMEPYLKYLNKDQFLLRVCTLQEKEGNPMANHIRKLDIPVDMVPIRRLRDPKAIPVLVRYLRRHEVDIVHTQLEFSNTLATLAARWQSIPTICTLHTFDRPVVGSKSFWRIRLMWWVLDHYCQRIIAVSEGLRQYYLHQAGFAPDKIVTLYNGINVENFANTTPNTRQALRSHWQIHEDTQLILTIAVLRPPKGIQHMLAALPLILAEQPNTRYIIVGDGEHKQALEALVSELNISDNVIFAGMRQDIPQILAAADLFVLPTLDDALPTVLIEAMAAQKPIVASEVGGVPELVEDGRNGLLVTPANPEALAAACLKLMNNQVLAKTMGIEGGNIAQDKFDIQKQVAALSEIYEGLLP